MYGGAGAGGGHQGWSAGAGGGGAGGGGGGGARVATIIGSTAPTERKILHSGPDEVSHVLKSLSPQYLFEILVEFKSLVQRNPEAAKQLLGTLSPSDDHSQLLVDRAFCLLRAPLVNLFVRSFVRFFFFL
jgi:hypothetical protein